jgi:hypothetical protein
MILSIIKDLSVSVGSFDHRLMDDKIPSATSLHTKDKSVTQTLFLQVLPTGQDWIVLVNALKGEYQG